MSNNADTMKSLTNRDEFDALTDEQVIAAAKSDPDAQPLTDEQLKRYRRLPQVPGGNFLDRIRRHHKKIRFL